jgi:multidrug efflux pump subunit AcrA (membrane-fusion protein)
MKRQSARTYKAALLLTLVPPAIGCGGAREAHPVERGAPVAVTVVPSVVRERPQTFDVAGVLHGQTSATLSSRVMATVREVLAQPGDRVRTGQVLLRLDDRDVSAAARQAGARGAVAERTLDAARVEQEAADAALALARATHKRIAALHERKSATPQELDQAVANLRAAEARVARSRAGLSEAQANLDASKAGTEAAEVTTSYATIVAPFDGLVTEKLVDPGNLVAPGTPLLRMEDTRTFELEVRVDESRAARIAPKGSVPVIVDGPDGPMTLTGRVSEVARAVDSDSRTLLVTIALPPTPGALTPGMFGRAAFAGPSRRLLTVPDGALVRNGQLTSVFVVDGERARLRFVNAGRSADGATEILAGLAEGESVVVDPPPGLRDGTPVTLRKAAFSSPSGATS